MGYYFKSVGLFLVRWTKYAWPAFAFIALDSVNVWTTYVEPELPPNWQGLNVPTPFFVLAVILLAFWAAAHVFYQVRKDRDDKAAQLEDTVDEEAVDELSALYEEVVNDIWNGNVDEDGDLEEWFRHWENWHDKVVNILEEEFPGGTAKLFRTVGFLDTPPVAGGYNEDHNEKLRTVMWKMQKLRAIVEEYSRTTT